MYNNKLNMMNMKKMKYILASLFVVIGLSSCDLNIKPQTGIDAEETTTLLHIKSLVNGVYNNMTTISSYVYMRYPDYYTDLFNETSQSGNRGGFFSRWLIYYTDQDVTAIWKGYYSIIAQINFVLERAEVAATLNPDDKEDIDALKGELYFFRGYCLHQLALRFCQDYDPAKAENQLGVPCPTSYDPHAKLNRGTLAGTYAQILEDIKSAEALVATPGEADNCYVSVDAVTAFKAQVALQMHDYENASAYAKSLYNNYELITCKEDMDAMWHHDSSTETILQMNLTSSTLALVGSTTYDYTYGSYNASLSDFLYTPGYVPEQWVCDLFDESDWRYGTCVSPSHIYVNKQLSKGTLLVKFKGNRDLFTSASVLTYKNMPKLFRVAEMYLIDAEAQYRTEGGDALTPLNALRAARGLAESAATGEELFAEIKKECVREFIGEGRRLFDLKRWGDGFKRDAQTGMSIVRADAAAIEKAASEVKFVWPIPQEEGSKNPNIGQQNEGYTQF